MNPCPHIALVDVRCGKVLRLYPWFKLDRVRRIADRLDERSNGIRYIAVRVRP